MPQTPYLVRGIVTKSNSLASPNSIIIFTTSFGTKTHTTESDGKYTFDLANIGYTSGEAVTYYGIDENENENYSGTFTISGGGQSLDIALSSRSDKVVVPDNRSTQLFNIGGKIVSEDNPLPVTLINTADIVDLTNNPNNSWDLRSDGQPTSETITIKGVSYKRTFTYSPMGGMTTRSKWVRQ